MSIPITPKPQLRRLFTEKYQALEMTHHSIKRHQGGLNHLFMYMDENHLDVYSKDVYEAYVSFVRLNPDYSSHMKKRNIRTVQLLNCFLEGKTYRFRHFPERPTCNIPSEMSDTIGKFIKTLEDCRMAHGTINGYRHLLVSFATKQMLLGNHSFCTINREGILDFMSSIQNADPSKQMRLRKFLKYIYNEGVIPNDFSEIFANTRVRRKEKLPSYYTKEEIRRLEQSIDRNCAVGKRDYAIILLASRLGLRSSDIRTMTFSNIDWEKSEIHLVQFKTKKELTLPLLSDVGDAIIDYVRHARPQVTYKEIFISETRPYRPISSVGYSGIVNRHMHNAGIDTKLRHKGMHSLRHSLATTLMNNGTSLHVISDTLGHQSSESTMCYLGVNIDCLLEYSLSVPKVDKRFYEQQGGMLYV